MRSLVVAVLALSAMLVAPDAGAQQTPGIAHDIHITAVQFKGSTTSDKVAAPPVDPRKLSRGYAYKGPGQADPSAPQRWEVASYQFSPSYVTVQQGDTVVLTVFIADGDHHDVQLTEPEDESILHESILYKSTWDRGREYTLFFLAKKVGAYRLTCATHAPSMTATFLVLPR